MKPALLVLLLAVSATAGEKAEWKTSTGRPFAQRLRGVPGINNVAEITPRLYRGGQPDSKGYLYLKRRGFKTVVSLREHHDEGKTASAAGLQWVHIPLHAGLTGSAPPTDADIKRFFDVVLDPKNQPVYFHCALGEDRTGTMAALYRMEIDGWTADEASQEMRAFGAHGVYKNLSEFVKNYKPRIHRSAPQEKPRSTDVQ